MAEAYSRGSAVRTLGNNLRMKPKGQFFLAEIGDERWQKGGDYESFETVPNIEEGDITSNEFPERTLVGIDITRSDIDINFSARMKTKLLQRIGMLSKKLTHTQEAVAAGTKTISLAPDEMIDLGVLDGVIQSVTGVDEDDVYALAKNFEFDAPSGMFGVLKHVDGVVPDADGRSTVTVKFTAPSIAGRESWGIMSDTQILVSVMFRGKNKYGPQEKTTFGLVQIRPAGNVRFGGDGDEFATMDFVGRVLVDSSRPADYQLGHAISLPKA